MNITLAIPVYDPIETDSLRNIVKYFHNGGCLTKEAQTIPIILVNDGSCDSISKVLAETSGKYSCCTSLISHYTNLGKGAAIKSAISFGQQMTSVDAMVFADSDGQHTIEDIEKMLCAARNNPNSFILGTRIVENEEISNLPLKSKIGRHLIGVLIKNHVRKDLKDSQSGLRSIPSNLFAFSLNLKENRYEYETRYVLEISKTAFSIVYIPVTTIYKDDNKGSRYRPFVDSARILFTFIRFSSAAILAATLDFIIFILLTTFGVGLFSSAITSKSISGLLYLITVGELVFIEGRVIRRTKKYSGILLLQILNVLVEPNLVVHLNNFLNNQILSKVLIDLSIFLLNFFILRKTILKLGEK